MCCQGCDHEPGIHNGQEGCTSQEGTRFRCLCYFSREMAAASSFDRAMAIRRAELLARAG